MTPRSIKISIIATFGVMAISGFIVVSFEKKKNTPGDTFDNTTKHSPARKDDDKRMAGKADRKVDQAKLQSMAITNAITNLANIYNNSKGADRDAAMTEAIDRLCDSYSKTDLIQALGDMPSGRSKQKWIWAAVQRGQGEFDERFFNSVNNLDFSEDRSTAIHAFSNFAKFPNRDIFDQSMEFISKNSDLDKQFIRSMEENIVRRYSSTLQGLPPARAAGEVLSFTENLSAYGASVVANAFLQDGHDKAISFAIGLSESDEIAGAAFSTIFDDIGASDPQIFEMEFEKVPSQYRNLALDGFVRAWLSEDPIDASKWIAEQPTEMRKVAAERVVKYLEDKNAPSQEIDPWRKMSEN